MPALLMHTCDNSSCVNPAHLLEGSPADNTADMMRKGRNRVNPDPKRGLESWSTTHKERMVRGERHHKAKLTESTVLAILADRATGSSFDALAAKYGVNKTTAHRVCVGKSWSHLGRPARAPQILESLR